MSQKKARVIALYLPQYHPTIENDFYWGKGFTEWTNVAKAKSLFHGHQQPRVPADLGFYDLRLPEVREAQAKMAREAGIEGFCYWHYWFGGGKETLQRPFDEVVNTGKPDFPFCVGWANHDWVTGTWKNGKTKDSNVTIFKQEYLGEKDHIEHFYRLLPAFKDKRYIKVDGKLVFLIFATLEFADLKGFFILLKQLEKKEGLDGFYFIGLISSIPPIKVEESAKVFNHLEEIAKKRIDEIFALGFDGVNVTNQKYAEIKTGGKLNKIFFGGARRLFPGHFVEKYDYQKIIENFYPDFCKTEKVYPQILAGWDRSPRSGKKAIIYYNDTPENFYRGVQKAISCVEGRDMQQRLLFLNSWNEWGEGAYMEPDLRYGKGKLQKLEECLKEDDYESVEK